MFISTRVPETAVRRLAQVLGIVIFMTVTWHAVVFLVASSRYFGAEIFWLEAGINLPLWICCWAGGLFLVRGERLGFRFLYLAAVLLFLGMAAGLFPRPFRIFGPPRWDRGMMFGFAALPVVFLIDRLLRRNLLIRPTGPPRRRLAIFAIVFALIAFHFGCLHGRVRNLENAEKELALAEENLAAWAVVIERYPNTPAWGVAVYNTGIYHAQRQRYREAIAIFEKILPSTLDDCDPTGNVMEAYQNYRHLACLKISSCHEGLGDNVSALRFALLAKNDYPYQSWCGTCLGQAHHALEKRIERLVAAGN